MGRMLRIARSRVARLIVQAGFAAAALTVTVLAVRHFLRAGWPLHGANVWLVLAAAALFVGAYAFKAWGWRRLFAGARASLEPRARHRRRRRGRDRARAARPLRRGGADLGRPPLPRQAHRAWARSASRSSCSDWSTRAALTPLSAVAAGISGASGWFLAGLILVAAAGVAAAALVLALPRLSRTSRLVRFRLARWVQEHCACPREAMKAWAFVSVSWLLRGAALFVLLHALGLGSPASASLALVFLCASAASAALPIAPAGAATQMGAGAAILVVSGMHTSDAVAFALSAQALIILAGASIVVAAAVWHAGSRLVPPATLRRAYTSPAVFDTLSDRLQAALGDLRGRGRLDEEAISRALREIRLALLEADVNFQVVKDFVAHGQGARARRRRC